MKIDFNLMGKLASEYDYQYLVEEFYGNIIANKLDKKFGIYVGFEHNTFKIDSLDLNIPFREVESYEALEKMIADKMGGNETDTKLKNKFQYFISDFRLTEKPNEIKKKSCYHDFFNTMGFFDLIWWVKKNEFIRNGTIGHQMMDNAQNYADSNENDSTTYFHPIGNCLRYQIRHCEWINLETVDSAFEGWQMKFLKNGKIQFKGISKEDWDKILYIFKICQ